MALRPTQPRHIFAINQNVFGRLPPGPGIVPAFENPPYIFRVIDHLSGKVPAGIRKVLAILIPNLMFFQQLL
jgi:hypothetical protein